MESHDLDKTRRAPCGNKRYGFSFEDEGWGHWQMLASWVRKNLEARLFFGKSNTQIQGVRESLAGGVLLLPGCSAVVS